MSEADDNYPAKLKKIYSPSFKATMLEGIIEYFPYAKTNTKARKKAAAKSAAALNFVSLSPTDKRLNFASNNCFY